MNKSKSKTEIWQTVPCILAICCIIVLLHWNSTISIHRWLWFLNEVAMGHSPQEEDVAARWWLGKGREARNNIQRQTHVGASILPRERGEKVCVKKISCQAILKKKPKSMTIIWQRQEMRTAQGCWSRKNAMKKHLPSLHCARESLTESGCSQDWREVGGCGLRMMAPNMHRLFIHLDSKWPQHTYKLQGRTQEILAPIEREREKLSQGGLSCCNVLACAIWGQIQNRFIPITDMIGPRNWRSQVASRFLRACQLRSSVLSETGNACGRSDGWSNRPCWPSILRVLRSRVGLPSLQSVRPLKLRWLTFFLYSYKWLSK